MINVSNAGHRISNVDLEDPNFERTPYDPLVAYGRWCEKIAERHRAGTEFMYLQEDCLGSFAVWLERARPGSFIPKDAAGRTASRASP